MSAAAAVRAFMARKNRSGRVIRETMEFRRVLGLPRREPDANAEVVEGVTHAQLWTPVLRTREYDDAGERNELRPSQAWAFSEAACLDGVVCNYPVGEGKTLLSFLLPTVWGAKRPLILLPAATLNKKTLKTDLPEARRNWFIQDNLTFISYEAMSREKQDDFFERFMFDVIVGDEAHRLKNPKAAVVKRLMRYKQKYNWVKCGFSSGTFTSKTIKEYYHLLWLALGDGSPLPKSFMDIEDWADLLDEGVPDDMRPMPGGMLKFCAAGETPRQGFQRRLRETPGYLSVLTSSVACSLVILERQVAVPPAVAKAIQNMRLQGITPDGDTITGPLEFSQHMGELINGFFYRWVWPDKPDKLWLYARRDWRRFVRWVIKHSGQQSVGGAHFDTEAQVAMAWQAGRLQVPHELLTGEYQVPADVYDQWVFHRERLASVLSEKYGRRMRDPPREAVWVSEYMVDHCLQWLENTPRGLLWVDKVAFQERLAARGALVFGGGNDGIVTETRTCAVSIDSHGEGKNLQHAYDHNLFLAVPSSGKIFEQALGRTHRQGQKADEVVAELFLPCLEFWNAFDQARRDAEYIEHTTGQRQKLRFADIDVTSAEEVVARGAVIPRDPLWCEDWSQLNR